MSNVALRDCVILVVEDEYLLAQDLCVELTQRDAVVLGPAATIEQGLALVHSTDRISCAVLDINLHGEPVFRLADELMARKVPFVFTTGYDSSVIPSRFAHVHRCEKPLCMSQLVVSLGRLAPA